jgi:hypothetical protein
MFILHTFAVMPDILKMNAATNSRSKRVVRYEKNKSARKKTICEINRKSSLSQSKNKIGDSGKKDFCNPLLSQ